MSVLPVNEQNFDKVVLQSDVPVLVDFTASWCGPCRMLAPIIEQLAADYAGRVTVCKVDVDDCPDLAQRYGVMSVPMLMLVKDGEVANKTVGAIPKNRLAAMLDAAL